MIINKEQFLIVQDNFQKNIDVDDSRGRSCPVNMNFIEEGYLSKDTGFSIFGATSFSNLFHSLFYFKKKSGTTYILGATGTKMKKYDTGTSTWIDLTSGNVTLTIASPCVVSQTAHGLKTDSKITFSTTGALPTGITTGVTYYIIATGLTADAFQFSATLGGSAVNTSGSQSGTHTIIRLYTSGAEFGYQVYDDNLYFGNAVENYTKFTGTTFTEYNTAPKGNIMEVFEDRMFVSGVTSEPLSIYFSKTSDPTDFTISSSAGGIVKPLGTDSVMGLENYYGQLLIFKQTTIWKLTFIYDSVVTLFVPKLELQSGNYGVCSRKSVVWVENDIWFFTGREVRSIGYKDQQTGILGVNQTVISEQIKETLYTISLANYSKCVVGYHNRRFYLGIPLSVSTVDTIFVSHLLYGTKWTKYTGRDKAKINDMLIIDNDIYSSISSGNYGVLKWDETLLNDVNTQTIYKETFDSNPTARGWLVGSHWEYDATNHNMKKI